MPLHGDPTAANLPGRDGDVALGIDWGSLGFGPVGVDLGLHAVSAREGFEPLLDAYLLGLPRGLADPDDVLLGARVAAVFTALSRAEWALARAAPGRARWRPSTATPPSPPTCAPCNGCSRRSRRWWAESLLPQDSPPGRRNWTSAGRFGASGVQFHRSTGETGQPQTRPAENVSQASMEPCS